MTERIIDMIAKNDEKKRNMLWRTAISVSSVLIIIIAAFFFIKLFTANPMEGTWSSEEKNLVMKIQGNGTTVMKWPDEFDGEEIAVSMNYDLDKEAKIFILHRDDEAIKEVVKKAKGAVTTDRLNIAISSLEGSYDYNIEQTQLTLTEREYGEQMVFEKQ